MHSQLLLLFQEILQELHLQICAPEQLRITISLLAPFTLGDHFSACEMIAFAVLSFILVD